MPAITDSQESLRGTVRLLGGMTVCLYVFPPLLTELKRQHPDIDLKLMSGSTERCLQHLRSGAGDLALLTLPVDQPDLVTVPVLQEELLLVTAAKHPLSRKRKVLPQDLVRQPFVLFESGSNTRRAIDEFFLTARIEPQIVMETENVEIIKALVRNGLGITIIPYQAVARDVTSRAPLLRAHRGPLARPRDRLGLPQDEPDPARRPGSHPRLRARPPQAQARALGPTPRVPAPPKHALTACFKCDHSIFGLSDRSLGWRLIVPNQRGPAWNPAASVLSPSS